MFAEIVQARREALGLSRKELAERVDVTPHTIRYWEKGERAPRPYMVARLARALACTTADLQAPHHQKIERMMFIASRLRRLRKSRGVKQAALAKHVGVTRAMVSRWENCHFAPYPNDIPYICEALGVSQEEFWEGFEGVDA
jgi:transcriptional regulator with XRE-family HTH domain